MKKYVLMTAAVLAVTMPELAWSQTAPSGGAPSGGDPNNGQSHQEDPQRFTEHKNEILTRMHEHLAEVQKRISCVQAASNHEQLHACLPEMGHGGPGGPGHHNFGGNGGQPSQQGGNGGPPSP